jgi:hypothetical protein
MSERQQLPRRHDRGPVRSRRRARGADVRHRETIPTDLPPSVLSPDEPSLLGFPAELPDDTEEPSGDVVATDDRPVALRRPDAPAGSLLLVAGTAAGMSLFLPWVRHGEALGLSLVQQGVELARTGMADFARSGLVLPVGVAAAGVVLFLAGLLAFRPARTHRPIGVVALFVSLAVAAGIVVRVADRDWDAVLTDPGTLCAIAVAGFGLLGALKAMLTAPEVRTEAG